MDQQLSVKHPKGLYVLFFTEMWERFSYYGMRAIFVLYLAAKITGDNPGVGWEKADAVSLYGWYTMMVYVMAVPGGWLADRFWGQKKTVMIGGILLCVGHLILAFDTLEAFYTGCIFVSLKFSQVMLMYQNHRGAEMIRR